jgi:hypothetical protein
MAYTGYNLNLLITVTLLLFFVPEDGGFTFTKVGKLLPDYTALHPRRQKVIAVRSINLRQQFVRNYKKNSSDIWNSVSDLERRNYFSWRQRVFKEIGFKFKNGWAGGGGGDTAVIVRNDSVRRRITCLRKSV